MHRAASLSLICTLYLSPCSWRLPFNLFPSWDVSAICICEWKVAGDTDKWLFLRALYIPAAVCVQHAYTCIFWPDAVTNGQPLHQLPSRTDLSVSLHLHHICNRHKEASTGAPLHRRHTHGRREICAEAASSSLSGKNPGCHCKILRWCRWN